ncbi:hypothetical protein CsSME_00046482 [Camellia sinensis var. sinensis]
MGSLICPNGAESVIHSVNWPVVLLVFRPINRHFSTPTSGLTATHLFAVSLLLLFFCLLCTMYTSYKTLFYNGFAINILLFLMDSNNLDDNQDIRIEEVQKNQTKGRSTVRTVTHWNHFATELQNLYGFQYTPK